MGRGGGRAPGRPTPEAPYPERLIRWCPLAPRWPLGPSRLGNGAQCTRSHGSAPHMALTHRPAAAPSPGPVGTLRAQHAPPPMAAPGRSSSPSHSHTKRCQKKGDTQPQMRLASGPDPPAVILSAPLPLFPKAEQGARRRGHAHRPEPRRDGNNGLLSSTPVYSCHRNKTTMPFSSRLKRCISLHS